MRWLVVVALALAPAIALADQVAMTDTPDQAASRAAMHDYFDGERTGGYILIGMGAAGLIAGGVMLTTSSLHAKGAAYSLLTIGVLHAAAGIYINIASAGRVDEFDAKITKDNAAWVRDESKRMKGVSTQFTILKITELVLAAGGLGLAAWGASTDRPRVMGAGLAITAEMLLTFGFDIFAARRAHDYRDKLAQVTVGVNLEDERAPSYVIGLVGTF